MKSQAPFSLHLLNHPEDHHLSPMSESNSATSSPLYSGCGGGGSSSNNIDNEDEAAPHDESVAIGNETMFCAEHNPQLMSTPVKGDDECEGDVAKMPQQSTPLQSNQPQEALDETDLKMSCPSTAKKEKKSKIKKEEASVGKRKRDSLESIDSSMVMPEGRVTRSVKRLKRFNTTAKGLRRNLSFNAMKSPFTNLLRRGRSSMMDSSTVTIQDDDQEDDDDNDVTETDCTAAAQERTSTMTMRAPQTQQPPTNKSPTFKTPIALPPINNSNAQAAGARAKAGGGGGTPAAISATEWRTTANASMFDDSFCLPEIQEEGGSTATEEDDLQLEGPEGKSAPADPVVDYLLLTLTHSLILNQLFRLECCCPCSGGFGSQFPFPIHLQTK